MFLDLICTDNQISCNVRAAKLLGLECAIYLNELINIYAKATKKDKLNENGYFRLSRSYITTRTTLTFKRQLELDQCLQNVEIITKDKDDSDLMCIDIDMYASILTNQDSNISKKVEKLVGKKSKLERDEDKKTAIMDRLKSNIKIDNEELRNAYYDWIESVYAKPGGFLSNSAIKIFEDTVNSYAKGDLDLALAILRIATVRSYKNADWVINIYEEQNKNKLRTTTVRNLNDIKLSDISY